jgi:hypothetical protein
MWLSRGAGEAEMEVPVQDEQTVSEMDSDDTS